MGNHLYHEAASRGNCAYIYIQSLPLPPFPPPALGPPSSTDTPRVSAHPTHADEVIDLLLDQPAFECDPVNRLEGDTPLHSAIRWLNAEPPAQRPFGLALVSMMLEAGSSPRARNRARLTPAQLVDPSNQELRDLIRQHEYASQNAGDFADVVETSNPASNGTGAKSAAVLDAQASDDDDDDAEFSGSDDEERAEWERRRRERKARK